MERGAGAPLGMRPRKRSGGARSDEVTMKLCGFEVGLEHPLFVIAGPCVVESREMAMDTAGKLKKKKAALGPSFFFKTPHDTGNPQFRKTFLRLGVEKGLRMLS